MKVPQEILKLIEAAESLDLARYAAERRRAEAETAKRRRILDLKMTRYDEVWGNAEFFDRWRIDFLQTPEAARLWRLLGPEARLPIFAARFWLGEPSYVGERTTWAMLVLDGRLHHPRYEEWHRGHRSLRGERLTSVQDIFDGLHPDFLKQLREHLEGPDAWKYVLQELTKRT